MGGPDPAGDGAPDPLLGQLVRFVAVGALSAVVDLSVYTVGLHVGWPTYAARAVSFVCGTSTAYVLNRRWAFRVAGGARRAGGFVLLYGTTFGVVLGVNALALALLPSAWWRVTAAWVLSQGLGTACNFAVLRTVVFRRS
ncbi:GtrA family protein [Geodermatophilus amargosae]|uniref:GtrA family protein n=1 Tax=Geodermatophilus amargosae TaxID=1296565 RepID=UPI0034DEE49B